MAIHAAIRIGRAAVFAALAVPAAGAQAPAKWTGPDLARVPKNGDIDFALSEVCFPFLLGQATINEIGQRQRIKLTKASNGGLFNINKGDMSVTATQSEDGKRSCRAVFAGGDAAELAAIVRARLATWPAGYTLGRGQRTDSTFIAYEHYCSPAEGVQDHAEVIAGQGGAKPKQKRIAVTLSRGYERSPSCDSDAPYNPFTRVG